MEDKIDEGRDEPDVQRSADDEGLREPLCAAEPKGCLVNGEAFFLFQD